MAEIKDSRRCFLKTSSLALIGATLAPTLSKATLDATTREKLTPKLYDVEKTLNFYNLHTGESIKSTFWADGEFVTEGLKEINTLLRDFRTNDVIKIDPLLIDTLYEIQGKFDSNEPIHVISGYRSPKTNNMLRKAGRRVAKNSYHMKGQAIDIRIPGVKLSHLRKAALQQKAGGVGYYPSSNFLHVDTGRVRTW